MKTINPFVLTFALMAIIAAIFALTSCSVKLGADGSKEATLDGSGVGEFARAIIVAK